MTGFAAARSGDHHLTMSGASIWLVEHDRAIGATLLRTLGTEGYEAQWARSIDEARALRGEPDLVVLDRALPDGDGLELCRELLAQHPGLRVLVLTRTAEPAASLGADAASADLLTMPLPLTELLSHIRAQLEIAALDAAVQVGDLRLDLVARRVRVGEEEVALRPKEFDLIARLAAEPGAVVARRTLMSDVWGRTWFGATKTLDVHIAALRRQLDPPDGPSRITTVRGVGYRLEAP